MQKSSFFKNVKFKLFDTLILIIFVVVIATSFIALRNPESQKASVVITTPFGEYIYDLNQDRDLKIKGLIGISLIKIENGTARFIDSPCPNKTCVACAPIKNNLDWTACLPNQVFIRVDKKDEKQKSDVSSF